MRVAQRLAAAAVSQVLAGHNLTAALEALYRQNPAATAQQRAAARDLSHGALRFYGRLAWLLGLLLERPLRDETVHALLLVALYQLLYDRADDHTVVNQAVEAAASPRKPWAKGLVNAVLRGFLRRRTALTALEPPDEVARYSYPQWWIDRLKAQYPADWQSMLEIGNTHPPMTLRVNLARTTLEQYGEALRARRIECTPLGEQAVMLARPLPVGQLPGFAEGLVSVQDYGAQFAARALDLADGMRVLDACCAPGGKTGHILELADVRLLALDRDAARLQRVRDNLDRLQLRAELRVGDAATPQDWWDGVGFDRILLDVPCSASGVVRRHVDIKWLRRASDVALFAEQQAEILEGVWRLLAKGGKLLYATCSVFHEENRLQINRFRQQHADAVQHPLAGPQDGQRIPCERHDGFFYALLQKT